MNKLIYDAKLVEQFAAKYYQEGDVHLVALCARRKYAKGDESLLERLKQTKSPFMDRRTVPSPDGLLRAVKKYEVSGECYVDLVDGKPFPTSVMVVYATVNPRDVNKAVRMMATTLVNKVFESGSIRLKDAKIKTYLQKCQKKRYVGIDIDTKDDIKKVIDAIRAKIDTFDVIETRGGYHVYIAMDAIDKTTGKFLYQELPKLFPKHVDSINSDLMCPVPGTLQGGFKVRFCEM